MFKKIKKCFIALVQHTLFMLKQKQNKSRDNLYTITHSIISSYNSMIIYTG